MNLLKKISMGLRKAWRRSNMKAIVPGPRQPAPDSGYRLTDSGGDATLRGVKKRVVVIDNYDSFTYNLVQYLETLGASCDGRLNDRTTPEAIAAAAPDGDRRGVRCARRCGARVRHPSGGGAAGVLRAPGSRRCPRLEPGSGAPSRGGPAPEGPRPARPPRRRQAAASSPRAVRRWAAAARGISPRPRCQAAGRGRGRAAPPDAGRIRALPSA